MTIFLGRYHLFPLSAESLGFKNLRICPSRWIRQILFLSLSAICSMLLQLLALAQNTVVGSKCSFSNHHICIVIGCDGIVVDGVVDDLVLTPEYAVI